MYELKLAKNDQQQESWDRCEEEFRLSNAETPLNVDGKIAISVLYENPFETIKMSNIFLQQSYDLLC